MKALPDTKDFGATELRSRERVVNYLLAEFDRPHLQEGARLPTNKELALRLQVSLGTVQSVLQQFAHEGRVRARRGSGTFFVSRQREPETLRLIIGMPLDVLQGQNGEWLNRIGGGMFRAALDANPPVALQGIKRSNWGTDALVEELLAIQSRADGLFLFPYTLHQEHQFVIKSYEESGKPVIRIQPPFAQATADFVSLDYFGSSSQLGRAWHKAGRRRVVFLAPLPAESSRPMVSFQLSYAGLANGLASSSEDSPAPRLASVPEPTEECGYETVRKLLALREIPDAIFCFTEQIGQGALRACREANVKVPEAVSIVAATGGNGSGPAASLTRIRQPLEEMGKELIQIMGKRIALKGISLPGVILPVSFVGGGTTLPLENDVLEIQS